MRLNGILCILGLGSFGPLSLTVRADSFDEYTLPIISQAVGKGGVQEIAEITADQIIKNGQVLPNVEGAVVFVTTNQARWAKLLLSVARHKVSFGDQGEPKMVPVIRLERFVTFREGGERSIMASGQGISLFEGFRYHLELGQVVPDALGGDLHIVARGAQDLALKPVGKAKLYLLTKALPEAAPRGVRRLEAGEKFDPSFFAGSYRLQDDGRRSGLLRLAVGEGGDITGTFVSEQNGREYTVQGSIGRPNYKVQFVIQFPQTHEEFTGYMFTGNGQAIAGISKMQEREAGFFAVRIDEKRDRP